MKYMLNDFFFFFVNIDIERPLWFKKFTKYINEDWKNIFSFVHISEIYWHIHTFFEFIAFLYKYKYLKKNMKFLLKTY